MAGRVQRSEEYKRRVDAAVQEKLGERVNEMILVQLVFTNPDSQGHGYGGMLLDSITRLVSLSGGCIPVGR